MFFRTRLAAWLVVSFLMFASADCGMARAAENSGTPAVASVATHDFSGRWETTFGMMTLKQEDGRVSGQYIMDGEVCAIEGAIEEGKLKFRYTESNAKGDGRFTLSEDGKSFKGLWQPDGTKEWFDWRGTRIVPFEGLWSTTWGPMRLRVSGDRVEGTYLFFGECSISGELKGHVFTFNYSQADGESGSGSFQLAEDGLSFSGNWQSVDGRGGSWRGDATNKNEKWLVVLEANWELGIAQPEYSFGEMLEGFFSPRIPGVHVRHRFVHDLADLKRFTKELQYLPGTVVLHISSHGESDGLALSSGVVSADEVVSLFSTIHPPALLHFGSCLIMAGDIPKRIIESRGPDRAFPISGYTEMVDWTRSALVDFSYLALVLERGAPPSDAAVSLTEDVAYAKELGFKILDPQDVFPQ